MAEVVTLKSFSEKLNANAYPNGSAARKAIARFQGWDDAVKGKARKLIDAKFGPATAAKVAAPKVAPKIPVKAAAKAAPKAQPAKAVKAAPVKASAKVAPKAPAKASAKVATSKAAPKAKVSPSPKAPKGPFQRPQKAASPAVDSKTSEVFLASQCIHTCAVALENATKIAAKSQLPKESYTKIAEIQNKALSVIQDHFGTDTVSLEPAPVAPRRRSPAQVKLTAAEVKPAEAAPAESAAVDAPVDTTATAI